MNMDYKSYHEEFMMNNNGTSAGDVLITVLPNILTVSITRRLILYLGLSNIFCKFLIDYVMIIVPVILGTTVLAELRSYWLVLCAVFGIIIFYIQSQNLSDVWGMKVDRRKKWHCISIIRAVTLLVSCLAILAVDFKIFPRYFAKTENFGFSLMDVGVGLFVYCNALVPPALCRHSLYKTIEINGVQCFILVVLGLGRLILTKSINYQEHITEYGVHWNFFLTLALTKIVTASIMCLFKEEHSLITGILLLVLHETLLNNGLSSWVFSNAPRNNFLLANREGLVSSLGYISLFMISSYIGQTIRENFDDKKQGNVVKTLIFVTIISWLGLSFCDTYLSVSRCLANTGYCLFVLAIGTTCLLLAYVWEITEPINKTKEMKFKKIHSENNTLYQTPSVICTSINNNGLLYFLLSNVTTGLINMSFKTLHLNTASSLFLISFYMLILPALILLYQKKCESKHIKTKIM